MPSVLEQILAHKRAEVEERAARCPQAALQAAPEFLLPRRNFYGAVSAPRTLGPNLIAEIKQTSPSAGTIRADLDPVEIARQYAAGGAHALSILTDERFFGGSLERLAEVKANVSLPVLRKDFLIDPYQIYESRAAGADAVLIIVEAVGAGRVAELVKLARELDLWVLLEVHTREALLAALPMATRTARGGVLVGINNRDLHTQTVDLGTTERLAALVPPGVPVVAESGLRTRADVSRMHAAGARAVLVGESLLRSGDPAAAVRELLE